MMVAAPCIRASSDSRLHLQIWAEYHNGSAIQQDSLATALPVQATEGTEKKLVPLSETFDDKEKSSRALSF